MTRVNRNPHGRNSRDGSSRDKISRDGTAGDKSFPLPSGVRGTLPEVVREHLVGRLLDAIERHSVAFVIAAPGMGKTVLLGQVVERLRGHGHEVARMSFEGASGEDIIHELKRHTRRISRRRVRKPCALVIDAFPSLDDCDIEEVVHELDRLARYDCMPLIAMRPEASQIVEDVRDPFVLSGHDLCVLDEELQRWVGLPDRGAGRVLRATGGVCMLVDELRHVGLPNNDHDEPLLVSLPVLLEATLRTSLMHEERAMRLAMVLLGGGVLEDIEACAGRVDADVALSVSQDEPLLGMDRGTWSFKCADVISARPPEHCVDAIRRASIDLQDVAATAACRLMQRGDARRAAFALRCCADEGRRAAVALEWPGELICLGEQGVLREAMLHHDGASGGYETLAQSMVASLDGDSRRAGELLGACPRQALRTRAFAQAEALLAVCRAAKGELSHDLPGCAPAPMWRDGSSCPQDGADEISRALRLHVWARSMLAEGNVEDAYRELLFLRSRAGCTSLGDAFLEQDLIVAAALMGDDATMRETLAQSESADFLVRGGYHGLLAYHMAERDALAGLVDGTSSVEQLDRALQVASSRGDTLVYAGLLLAKATHDLVSGALARAHVLARQARDTLGPMGLVRPRAVAVALDVMIDLCLGAAVNVSELDEEFVEARDVPELALACELVRGRMSGARDRMVGVPPCTASSLPMLAVMLRHCGSVSEQARAIAPEGWVARVDAYAAAWESGGLDGLRHGSGGSGGASNLLEVRMMGGLSVVCGGREISDRSWKRKAARELLELLAVVPRHELSRIDVSDALWPQSDLYTARNNTYAVMTALRRALGQHEGGPQYVILDSGHIRMSRDLLRCDVDDFRKAAGQILDDEGDDRVRVRRCCELESRFPGNIVVPASDPTGLFTRCRDEITTLYADAMVAGAEAAVRLGRPSVAVRLARSASDADQLREDVEECMVRALVAGGRMREARAHYESYATRIISSAGVPPSTRLRALVRETCEGGAETGRAYREDGSFGDGIDA